MRIERETALHVVTIIPTCSVFKYQLSYPDPHARNTEKSVVPLGNSFVCVGSAALILAHVKTAQTQTLELNTAG